MMNSETRQDVLSIMLLHNILQHEEIMKKQTPEHGCMLYYHQQLTLLFTVHTDVYIIGLPLIKTTNKVVFVQLKDTSYEKCFLNMNRFVFSLKNDICFQGIQNIEECIQLVYILSGCD